MTTRPSLGLGPRRLPGLIALGFFAIVVWIVGSTALGEPAGFPTDVSITANLGYALLDATAGADAVRGEGFLVALEVVALALVAALVGAVMLARREVGGDVVTALLATDGSQAASVDQGTDGRSGRSGGEE